ncbi:MAG: ELM1/GtrOC1 family putative glycosyltransferase, partial [Proteobacteria bacterium]|nr:ELM1/GtrOC1 family putative glycosyltransferase [Pseudomonadota bacterium]
MKSQIEGLANLIGYKYRNIDLKIHYLFRILPVQLIPSNTIIIKNLNDYQINKPTVLISCGKKSVKASIALKKKYKNIFNIHI